jgi:hypothetical protein
VIGIDIGKNSFHVVGLDRRGAIALRQKWSRGQVDARLAISLQERRARPESRLGVTICRSDSRQCTAADPELLPECCNAVHGEGVPEGATPWASHGELEYQP